MSRERPILFSGPMIRALLDGTKSQTRRILKHDAAPGVGLADPRWEHARDQTWIGCDDAGTSIFARCPYGQPGDRLWARETWMPYNVMAIPPANERHMAHIKYAAGGEASPIITSEQRMKVKRWGEPGADAWVPSIHMYRWAARLTLEVTEVRVDRGPVSEEDALAEGVARATGDLFGVDGIVPFEHHYPQDAFTALFEAINGPGSIDKWRWALSFKMSERAGTERTC